MFLRRKLFGAMLMSLMVFAFLPGDVSAEGDSVCVGRVMGVTANDNADLGRVYFDAHPKGFSDAGKVAPLDIAGKDDGFAPSARDYAACVVDPAPSILDITNKEFPIWGWAWGDNWGFISFAGNGANNPAGSGANPPIATGGIKYATLIDDDSDGDGSRTLLGHAWAENMGYIQWSGTWADPSDGSFGSYGVKIDGQGNASGYAWLPGFQLYMNFDGMRIELPGGLVPKSFVYGSDICENEPYICAFGEPDSSAIDGGDVLNELVASSDTDIPVADGEEDHDIFLSMKEADGVTPMDLDNYSFVISFDWTDTVKRNQLYPSQGGGSVGTGLNDVAAPWSSTTGMGAVVSKPVLVSSANFSTYFEPADIDDDGSTDPGYYHLKNTIRSYAPTSNTNISYLVGTDEPVAVSNELFTTELETITGTLEHNNLILHSISYDLNQGGVDVWDKVGTINGQYDYEYYFRPAREFVTFYAQNFQDAAEMLVNRPVDFSLKAQENGNLSAPAEQIDVVLDYDINAVHNECVEIFQEGEDGFVIYFTQDEQGQANSDTAKKVLEFKSGDGTWDTLFGALKKVVGIATLPGDQDAGVCERAEGGTLYTVIQYEPTRGKVVKYLGAHTNEGYAVSPSVEIHGNIYASDARSGNINQVIQNTGEKIVDTVRNAVGRNGAEVLGINFGENLSSGDDKKCTMTSLSASGISCDLGASYDILDDIDGEQVIYFKDIDLTLEMDGAFDVRGTVMVDSGDVFIDENIYSGALTNQSQLALAVFGPISDGCGSHGNVYIHTDVSNIQANIFADCSVQSYNDSVTFDSNGYVQWGTSQAMIDNTGKQLIIEGSIASNNTIGGALSDPRRDGFGLVYEDTVGEEQLLKIQQHDVLFWRNFRGAIRQKEGKKYDFSCDKYLSPEEELKIAQWNISGEGLPPVFIDDNGDGQWNSGEAWCDGIDPVNKVGEGGDVAPPANAALYADGLDPEEDLEPLYIYYVAPDSFLFKR